MGDVFTCDYLYVTCSFQVIGFFPEGAVLGLPLSYTPLDTHIVMPMFALFEHIDLESIPPFKIHLANRVSGQVLAHPEEDREAYAELEEILAEYPSAGTFSLSSSSLLGGNTLTLSTAVAIAAVAVLVLTWALARSALPMKWWGTTLSFLLMAGFGVILLTALAGFLSVRLPMAVRLLLPSGIWASVLLCLQLPRKAQSA